MIAVMMVPGGYHIRAAGGISHGALPPAYSGWYRPVFGCRGRFAVVISTIAMMIVMMTITVIVVIVVPGGYHIRGAGGISHGALPPAYSACYRHVFGCRGRFAVVIITIVMMVVMMTITMIVVMMVPGGYHIRAAGGISHGALPPAYSGCYRPVSGCRGRFAIVISTIAMMIVMMTITLIVVMMACFGCRGRFAVVIITIVMMIVMMKITVIAVMMVPGGYHIRGAGGISHGALPPAYSGCYRPVFGCRGWFAIVIITIVMMVVMMTITMLAVMMVPGGYHIRAAGGISHDVDPHHVWEVSSSMSSAARAVSFLNSEFCVDDRIPSPVPPLKQQTLSLALDKVTLASLTDPGTAGPERRAHLNLLLEPWAGAWAHAMPSHSLGTALAPEVFVVALQRRLRLQLHASPYYCPKCDGVMDVYADHALVCSGGGDRTVRHNALRNAAFCVARAAGARPELEKPGLLRPRPLVGDLEEDGVRRGGSRGAAARRPADVFFHCFRLGARTALDFAVTSGLKSGAVFETASDASTAVTSYEARKRAHLSTDLLCREEGILFIPMIMEAVGGSWGPAARAVWHELARCAARLTGEPFALKAEQISQDLSIILHRENATAILRRPPPLADLAPAMARARSALESAEAQRLAALHRCADSPAGSAPAAPAPCPPVAPAVPASLHKSS
eukprot:gene19135-biopygen16944